LLIRSFGHRCALGAGAAVALAILLALIPLAGAPILAQSARSRADASATQRALEVPRAARQRDQQRATLQLWTEDQPWAAAGTVVVSNGGDIAKEAGLWPLDALAPESAIP